MDSYKTPSKKQRFELEIKRSRFITTVEKVSEKQHALRFITEQQKEMPDANHHCWAMIAGQPDDIYQHDQSDDGEPKGTAGKPMLNVLSHSGFGNIVVVVTRYFGGIKLGTGGLVRAYTQSTTEALKKLVTETTYIRTEITIELPYNVLDTFVHWMKDTNIVVADKQFQQSIIVKVHSPESEIDTLQQTVVKLGGSIVSNLR